MNNFFTSLGAFIEKLPRWIVILAVVLTLAAIPGLFLLQTDSSLNSLVSPNSTVYSDTQRYREKFGDERVTVILNGKLQDIFSTDSLAQLARFEREFPTTHDCYITSPITILNQAVQQTIQAKQALEGQLSQAQEQAATAAKQQAAQAGLNEQQQEQAAAQARAEVLQQFQPALTQLEQLGEPSLNNPVFVSSVLYARDGSISSSFASLVPDQEHVLVVITPTGDITPDKSLALSHDAENYFAANQLPNISTKTIGYTLVTEAISDSMKSNLLLLLGLAVLVMIVVLSLLFRVRWRLLSLLMVGVGAIWTFGLMGYISIPITMATMAVLPVLIGLGIDYPIQFHNRYQEELTRSGSVKEAIIAAVSKMLPAVGIAMVATVVGFATLYVSTIPMIRDFGTILGVGVVLCYLVALFLLYSIVFLGDRRVPVSKLGQISARSSSRIERLLAKVAAPALKYPAVVIAVAVLVGIGGGIADHWLPVNTDYQQLIPQSLPALQNVRELNTLLGNGGQITFMVEADNVASQKVLTQLKDFSDQEIAAYPEIVSANSAATLVAASAQGNIPDQDGINRVLASTASPLVKAVISDDARMGTLSFGIKYLSLDETSELMKKVTQDSRSLDGIRIAPVGMMALSTATIDSVVDSRILMDILCLGAIFVILLLIYRNFIRSLFIILSIGLVIGWSTLAMLVMGVELNPLTAVLGVITTAIGTEFMVLLHSRYEEEKARGEPPRQAMQTAVSKMGRAIVTTGITTLGGFGVLIASNFVMIRDFGIVTVIGIFLCLISSILVMPALMISWDERKKKSLKLDNRVRNG